MIVCLYLTCPCLLSPKAAGRRAKADHHCDPGCGACGSHDGCARIGQRRDQEPLQRHQDRSYNRLPAGLDRLCQDGISTAQPDRLCRERGKWPAANMAVMSTSLPKTKGAWQDSNYRYSLNSDAACKEVGRDYVIVSKVRASESHRVQ